MAKRPPKNNLDDLPGCNFWAVNKDTWNVAWTPHPVDATVFVMTDPHVYAEGWVEKVISEQDHDFHVWVNWKQGGKDRWAAEFDPHLLPDSMPTVGQHIGVWGVFRWDHQHLWSEIHPVVRWKDLDSGQVHLCGAPPVSPV